MILTYVGDSHFYEIENLDITIQGRVLEVIPPKGVEIPAKAGGFCLQMEGYPACNYAAYKTVYRTIGNRIQFSNDGSVWTEPLRDITVEIIWNDNDNAEGTRPNAVKADVLVDGEKLETVTLNEKNHWKKEYIDIPESKVYTITAKDINGYEKAELGLTIIYTDSDLLEEEPQEDLSKDEQIERLTNLVTELMDRVNSLEAE